MQTVLARLTSLEQGGRMASNGTLIVNGPSKGEFIDGLKYPQLITRLTTTGGAYSGSIKLRITGVEQTEDDGTLLFRARPVNEDFTRELRGLFNTHDRTGIIVEIDEDPVEMLRARKETPVP